MSSDTLNNLPKQLAPAGENRGKMFCTLFYLKSFANLTTDDDGTLEGGVSHFLDILDLQFSKSKD